jgi:hypothetical protein
MEAGAVQRVSVIDSHTGGEPTRVVVAGGPDVGSATIADWTPDSVRPPIFPAGVACCSELNDGRLAIE